jgi:hypothetical protein
MSEQAASVSGGSDNFVVRIIDKKREDNLCVNMETDTVYMLKEKYQV